MYGDGEDIGIIPVTDDDYHFLDWMNENEDATSDLVPRSFIERFGYNNWQQVTEHVAQLEYKPWWWSDSEQRIKAKKKFVSLIAS